MQIGDVVRLKSSGPAMTVQSLGVNESCKCSWFVAPYVTVSEAVFAVQALVKQAET